MNADPHMFFFFFQAEDGIRDVAVTGVQTCALPISAEFWKRLDARPPTAVVVLKPDHVRDVDLFVRRYNARAFGPRLFFREDIPKTDLQFIEPGSHLPGGLIALYDGRGRNETPLWLPGQRTIVFPDALTAPA